jgi:hypothetical protein
VTENNPYPPSSESAVAVVNKSLTAADYVLLTLIMMQLVFSGFYTPHLLEDMLTGMVSLVAALAFVLAMLLLLLGALLVFFKSKFSVYVFAVSIVFGLFAAINFHPGYVITGIIVASAAIVVCLGKRT